MGCTTWWTVLYLLMVASAALVPASASRQSSYVVYMGSHSRELDAASIHALHHKMLASAIGSELLAKEALLYSYKNSINGFAAVLEPHHADSLSRMQGVISVFPNRAHSLHTTRSWEFLRLENRWGAVPEHSLWKKAKYGSDVIVGVFDTGVWPESASFSDEGLGPIPSRWHGTCETGSNFSAANCNRKLIGARYFLKGFEAANGRLNETATGDYRSPRDKDGHGSHTASTAAGNFVKGANEFGFAEGTAKGGAPLARLAVYKVCWPGGCFDADILAAFDAALSDGVDVLSLSLGSSPPLPDYFSDAITLGSFHAVVEGRVVVCSAGNDGPITGSVANVAPWIFTIAASSMDREFPAPAILSSSRHHHTTTNFTGASLSEYRLPYAMYHLVTGSEVASDHANGTASQMCFPGSLDPDKAKGKIVVCERGVTARVQKGSVVKEAGGVGMILLNQPSDADEVVADPHVLPATHVNAADGAAILDFINRTGASSVAYIGYPQTLLPWKPAPQMASFSSQGPNTLTADILKPDITAPGLNVLAAWTGASPPTADPSDNRVVQFNVISGTSMSCPHAAGVVALLRGLHPDWSAAAIKSALMTTAAHDDNVGEPILNGSGIVANPFNYGAGHINPNAAANPGLLYDAVPADYILFLCSLRYNQSELANITSGIACPKHPPPVADLNYPSVTLSRLHGSHTVTRTITYVNGNSSYRSHVLVPPGVRVDVIPSTLNFSYMGERKTFQLNFRAKSSGHHGGYVFGSLIWTDGTHHVTSPICVRPLNSHHHV